MIESDIPRRLVPDAAISVVLAEVANGLPLITACERAGIGRSSVYRWLETDPEFRAAYAQAVAQQTHARYARAAHI
jgi:hypothetical protein